MMVSAAAGSGCWRSEGFEKWCIDNGAWTAHTQGKPFNESNFLRCMDKLGDGAQFTVVPDIVAGGLESLAYSLDWLPRLEGVGLLLLAVQDGMTPDDIRPHLTDDLGIFVGGTTEWKLGTLHQWGKLARETGAYFHVGRVNTARRIRLCQDAGANSFDGSSVSRFLKTLPLLDAAWRRPHLWGTYGG